MSGKKIRTPEWFKYNFKFECNLFNRLKGRQEIQNLFRDAFEYLCKNRPELPRDLYIKKPQDSNGIVTQIGWIDNNKFYSLMDGKFLIENATLVQDSDPAYVKITPFNSPSLVTKSYAVIIDKGALKLAYIDSITNTGVVYRSLQRRSVADTADIALVAMVQTDNILMPFFSNVVGDNIPAVKKLTNSINKLIFACPSSGRSFEGMTIETLKEIKNKLSPNYMFGKDTFEDKISKFASLRQDLVAMLKYDDQGCKISATERERSIRELIIRFDLLVGRIKLAQMTEDLNSTLYSTNKELRSGLAVILYKNENNTKLKDIVYFECYRNLRRLQAKKFNDEDEEKCRTLFERMLMEFNQLYNVIKKQTDPLMSDIKNEVINLFKNADKETLDRLVKYVNDDCFIKDDLTFRLEIAQYIPEYDTIMQYKIRESSFKAKMKELTKERRQKQMELQQKFANTHISQQDFYIILSSLSLEANDENINALKKAKRAFDNLNHTSKLDTKEKEMIGETLQFIRQSLCRHKFLIKLAAKNLYPDYQNDINIVTEYVEYLGLKDTSDEDCQQLLLNDYTAVCKSVVVQQLLNTWCQTMWKQGMIFRGSMHPLELIALASKATIIFKNEEVKVKDNLVVENHDQERINTLINITLNGLASNDINFFDLEKCMCTGSNRPENKIKMQKYFETSRVAFGDKADALSLLSESRMEMLFAIFMKKTDNVYEEFWDIFLRQLLNPIGEEAYLFEGCLSNLVDKSIDMGQNYNKDSIDILAALVEEFFVVVIYGYTDSTQSYKDIKLSPSLIRYIYETEILSFPKMLVLCAIVIMCSFFLNPGSAIFAVFSTIAGETGAAKAGALVNWILDKLNKLKSSKKSGIFSSTAQKILDNLRTKVQEYATKYTVELTQRALNNQITVPDMEFSQYMSRRHKIWQRVVSEYGTGVITQETIEKIPLPFLHNPREIAIGES